MKDHRILVQCLWYCLLGKITQSKLYHHYCPQTLHMLLPLPVTILYSIFYSIKPSCTFQLAKSYMCFQRKFRLLHHQKLSLSNTSSIKSWANPIKLYHIESLLKIFHWHPMLIIKSRVLTMIYIGFYVIQPLANFSRFFPSSLLISPSVPITLVLMFWHMSNMILS